MTPYFQGWWRWALVLAFGVGVGWMLPGCAELPHGEPPLEVRHWEQSMVETYEWWTGAPLTERERACISDYLYLEVPGAEIEHWCGDERSNGCIHAHGGGPMTVRTGLGDDYPRVIRHEVLHKILKCVEGDSSHDHESWAFQQHLSTIINDDVGEPACEGL